MIHVLKTWPGPFAAVREGRKRHEIRRYDRPFAVGDLLVLREYDPDRDTFSGFDVPVRVTYLTLGGEWGLPADLCVMSIERLAP